MTAQTISRRRRRHRGLPIWRHSVGGALGVEPIDYDQLKTSAWQLVLPAALVLWRRPEFSSLIVLLGAVVVSLRLSRLDGDSDMVEFALRFWKWTFALASIVLLASVSLTDELTSNHLGVVPPVWLAFYVFGTFLYFTARRLIRIGSVIRLRMWLDGRDSSGPFRHRSIGECKREIESICEELERVWEQKIPEFDWETDLAQAWEHENTPEIAFALECIDKDTRDRWGEINRLFNTALSSLDVARLNLKRTANDARDWLDGFRLDAQTLESARGKRSQLEVFETIPASLAPERIDARYGGFSRASAKVMVDGTFGRVPFLAALAIFITLIVAQHIFTSRTLRRLRDVEGQIRLNESAARGDGEMFRIFLSQRVAPQVGVMVTVENEIENVERELGRQWDAPEDKRQVLKTRLALALFEAKRLTSRKGAI